MSDSKTAIIAAMAAMIMMVSAVAVFAVSDDASADETEKEYSIYIDLGGTVSAYFLGVEEDYGEASWETVQATNAKDALIAACEQKFGEGSITFNDWGGIDTINGMSGSGGSLKSEQSTGWDDVYFYPVQFVKEDGVWEQGSVTIHNYTGESTTFALTFQPITFDNEPVEHTFADSGDRAVYDELKSTYGWPGWGTFSEPYVSLAWAELEEQSATVALGDTYTPVILYTPEDAFNKAVVWFSNDETVATVDANGVITAVGYGTTSVSYLTHYGSYMDAVSITVPEPKEYSIYIDLGGKMTSWIVDYYDIESEDDLVDYGGPSWETVSAYSVKEALTLACEQKFGAGSIEFTTSGGIKTINGIDGNGTYLFPDQAMSSENEHWIFYYPIQFVQTDDGWSDMQVYIGAYDGDATTFAVVCQPVSFDVEPIEYTFDEYGGLLDGDDAQKMYDYFQEHFLWTYGYPSEPFFATTGITASETSLTISIGSEAQAAVEFQPDYATNKNIVWASSDESVATVVDGAVFGVSAGSAVMTATTVDGFFAEIQVEVVEPKEYSIYIDLGGTISGFFLGTDADYGEGSWETVTAATAREALTLACEQKFGEGSLVLTKGTYGWSITSVNGMPGNGGSLKSEQSTGWDDVYFYPVQFVKED
ncbi:MAG: Ig-like domain-containing protein, partial [Candidatus Methanomethylophilaceae archaeon]|nr:Ig-like domain-containing protein [Candidatus Methanomethylophilaceae archaeon]